MFPVLVLAVLFISADDAKARRPTSPLRLYYRSTDPNGSAIPHLDPLAPGEESGGNINLADPGEHPRERQMHDPTSGQYIIRSTVGEGFDYRPPMSMSLEEYLNYDMEKSMDNYWLDRGEG